MAAPKETGPFAAQALSNQIRGKNILITGCSPKGLGASFASIIAAHAPARIVLCGRNEASVQQTAEDLAALTSADLEPVIQTISLDLLSIPSVRAAAKAVLALTGERLDTIVLNAGIMATPYRPVKFDSGFMLDSQLAANHIGHFLFSNLLLDGLVVSGAAGSHAAETRVVIVASDGYRLSPVRFDDLDFNNGTGPYSPFVAYGQSKSANMLYAVSLARKLASRGVTAVSLHPGVVPTNLARDVASFDELVRLDTEQGNIERHRDYKTLRYHDLDEGVATHVRAAFDPKLKDYNGRYLSDSEVLPLDQVRSWARDAIEAEKLWKISEQVVGQNFSWN